MKKIYIFFIATEFKTGKAIRLLTRNKYNHVALSFEPSTRTLYSYARYRYREPLLSGFGVEYTDRYRNTARSVDIKVCEYEVTDEHYCRILDKIEYYQKSQSLTRYNFFDLFVYPFNKHIKLNYTHTCISFLLELLEMPEVHTIGGLEKVLGGQAVFEGPLGEFEETATSGPVDFFEKRRTIKVYRESGTVLLHLASSLVRVCLRRLRA